MLVLVISLAEADVGRKIDAVLRLRPIDADQEDGALLLELEALLIDAAARRCLLAARRSGLRQCSTCSPNSRGDSAGASLPNPAPREYDDGRPGPYAPLVGRGVVVARRRRVVVVARTAAAGKAAAVARLRVRARHQ